MKKLFCLFVSVVLTLIGLNSCLDSSENSAEASVDFGASLDSIVFEDPADSVFYEAIDTALQDLGVISNWNAGLPTKLFTEKATVNVSSIAYALQVACSQAAVTYQKRWDAVTLDALKKRIQLADTPAPQPVDSLNGFTYHSSLIYSFVAATLDTVKTYTKSF